MGGDQRLTDQRLTDQEVLVGDEDARAGKLGASDLDRPGRLRWFELDARANVGRHARTVGEAFMEGHLHPVRLADGQPRVVHDVDHRITGRRLAPVVQLEFQVRSQGGEVHGLVEVVGVGVLGDHSTAGGHHDPFEHHRHVAAGRRTLPDGSSGSSMRTSTDPSGVSGTNAVSPLTGE